MVAIPPQIARQLTPAISYRYDTRLINAHRRRFPTVTSVTLGDLSAFLAENGFANEIDGDDKLEISAVNTLEDATTGEISFLSNPKYGSQLATTKASAIITPTDTTTPNGKSLIKCGDPYAAVTAAIIRIHGYRKHPQWSIDDRAIIHDSAKIGDNANIAPYVTIDADVTIGQNCTIYPHCHVGHGAILGDNITLFPNVTIYDESHIGSRVTIHAGTVIGQDGLGYAPVNGTWMKIPQIGRIRIEDDVEIGANCALDRATLGETVIGQGTKFSNGVIIGHGAKIGQHCMLVGQVGIAGSAKVGNNVVLAGQVGVRGHLTIGDNAKVGAQAGVGSDLDANGEYLGSPAIDKTTFIRSVYNVHKLPQMKDRVAKLERELKQLRELIHERTPDNA